jgi:phospholipase A1
MLRANPATSKGAIQLDWTCPLGSSNIGFYMLAFDGYGESLIDYNKHVSRIGAGFTIVTKK